MQLTHAYLDRCARGDIDGRQRSHMAAERPTPAAGSARRMHANGGSEMLSGVSALIIYYDPRFRYGGHGGMANGLPRRQVVAPVIDSFPSRVSQSQPLCVVGRGISLSTHASLSYL
jgi:hypothetical protein